jgi:hypothetical protein
MCRAAGLCRRALSRTYQCTLFLSALSPVVIRKEHAMNRRHILGLSTVAVLGFALLPSSAVAQSLKDRLVGTWTAVSWEQVMPDGSKLERFGANPKGINVFQQDGHFFVMLARADLPKISANDPMKPTPEEAKAITTGSIAYFGTYTVDEGAKVVNMRIEGTTLPNQIGLEQKRLVTSLTADELKYENPTTVGGGKITIAWKRVEMPATVGSGRMAPGR